MAAAADSVSPHLCLCIHLYVSAFTSVITHQRNYIWEGGGRARRLHRDEFNVKCIVIFHLCFLELSSCGMLAAYVSLFSQKIQCLQLKMKTFCSVALSVPLSVSLAGERRDAEREKQRT